MSPLQGYIEGSETSSDVMSTSGVFPIQEKLALVLFSPLWLPLVLGAGVIALPVALGLLIKDTVTEKQKLKHFKQNKLSHMLKWAEDVLENFSPDSIFQVLKSDYLKSFTEQLEDVCENIIPKQIQADEKLMSNIMSDMRDSDTIKNQYQPLEKRCKEITGQLLVLQMEHFEGYSIASEGIKVGDMLGRGMYSEVREATFVLRSGETVDGAIKQMKTALEKDDCYNQMTEVKHLK